jgi:hypothetical protein
MPLLAAAYEPLPELDADRISFAPSVTRTPRYSYPPDVLQIATRELSVLPNSTAADGQRAVESTYPCESKAGAAPACGRAVRSNAEHAAAAAMPAARIR